ncbi:syntaxin [Holotrichia oblita]|uniref:Syntaxin n=1 Tax=Holotrichia oblita TaxID=644536 RepID=A0ACB9SWL8_HOLOL|nr:syntaxin [Holotrichia oblita]
MIKDRLPTLQIIQNTINNNVTTENTNEVVIEVPDVYEQIILDDPFFIEVEEIKDMIDNIKETVLQVKKKHSDILTAPQNDEKTKQELEELMLNIKKTSNKARVKLKNMEQEVKDDKNLIDIPSASLRMRTIQNSMLSRKFIDVMTEYNLTQTDFRERCKARIKRQLEITGRQTTDDELEDMLEQDNPAVFTQGIVIQQPDLKKTVADIEARYADIIKLESSIKELHDMFMDVALLVENQGELIDRVEFHVGQTQEYVEFGKVELSKAHVYRRRAIKKKLIVFVCIGVLTLIVLIILIVKL